MRFSSVHRKVNATFGVEISGMCNIQLVASTIGRTRLDNMFMRQPWADPFSNLHSVDIV